MVQKGKFSAGAALFVKTLKNVDFPTFGTPKNRNDQSPERYDTSLETYEQFKI